MERVSGMKKRYMFTLIFSLAILFILLNGMELWSAPNQPEAVKILSNGFAVIGAVLFCFGLIIGVDNLDGFLGFKVITYGARKFFHYALPFLFHKELETSFFEYRMNRGKRKAPVSHLLSIGGCYLLCSGILAVVFEYL